MHYIAFHKWQKNAKELENVFSSFEYNKFSEY